MTDVSKYADIAMYRARPDELAQIGEPVHPQVTLVSMTPKPIRVIAAAASLYSGGVVHDAQEVTKELALALFDDMSKTTLKAPLEYVDLHFIFEGVSRAFTHQLVRQRTAVYVQESMRFAVKDNAAFEVMMPPSIDRLADDAPQRLIWHDAVVSVAHAYNALIESGIPAEDARGLLPTNITTRVHYKTNLRNLAEHAGLRLCSQAQNEWKEVWEGILWAIRNYWEGLTEEWEKDAILSLFKPICYRTGRCEFRASTDRFCAIRDRVEAHHAKGEPPSEWSDINPMDALREDAARISPEMQEYLKREREEYLKGLRGEK